MTFFVMATFDAAGVPALAIANKGYELSCWSNYPCVFEICTLIHRIQLWFAIKRMIKTGASILFKLKIMSHLISIGLLNYDDTSKNIYMCISLNNKQVVLHDGSEFNICGFKKKYHPAQSKFPFEIQR